MTLSLERYQFFSGNRSRQRYQEAWRAVAGAPLRPRRAVAMRQGAKPPNTPPIHARRGSKSHVGRCWKSDGLELVELRQFEQLLECGRTVALVSVQERLEMGSILLRHEAQSPVVIGFSAVVHVDPLCVD